MKYLMRKSEIFPKGNIDADYEYYAGREGLYTVAFFGHGKGTPEATAKAKTKLRYIWNSLERQYAKSRGR